jgi:hypothetical protein
VHQLISAPPVRAGNKGASPRVEVLEPGSHLVTPRRGYKHHGIYVGSGKVVHYGGLARGLRSAPIEEVSLEQFAAGQPVWLRRSPSSSRDGDEIIRRARARVGENRYHVLTNNCEHFCQWCVRDEHRRDQVDHWLSFARGVVRSATALFRGFESARRHAPADRLSSLPSTHRFSSSSM